MDVKDVKYINFVNSTVNRSGLGNISFYDDEGLGEEVDFEFEIKYFYKMILTKVIPAMEDCKTYLTDLKHNLASLERSIIDYSVNKEEFFVAMGIISCIKLYYSEVKFKYDIDGNIIDKTTTYSRKSDKIIESSQKVINGIKNDPTSCVEIDIEKVIKVLKNQQQRDILDMLVILEDKLNPSIFMNINYSECIIKFKEVLNCFNNLTEKEKDDVYSDFCLMNIEQNKVLGEIEHLYTDYDQSERLVEECCNNLYHIIGYFEKEMLKDIATINVKLYSNIMSIIELSKDFLNEHGIFKLMLLISDLDNLALEGLGLLYGTKFN